MRNWNGRANLLATEIEQRFEPTYEELKPDATYVNIKRYLSFEPTYEELKLKAMRVTFGRSMGFEPTYEELKFWCPNEGPSNRRAFWAYLWGIETCPVIKF